MPYPAPIQALLDRWSTHQASMQNLNQQAEQRWPLDEMITGYGGGGVAPAVGAAGGTLGRIARTAKNLWPVRKAAKAAEGIPAGDYAPVMAQSGDMAEGLRRLLGQWQTPSSQAGSVTARTAPNLKAIQGDRKATWDALENLGWKKWMLDVPAAPRGTEPLAIRTPNLAHSLFDELHPAGQTSPAMKGWFYEPTNIAAYSKASQTETLPHEFLHWSRADAPTRLWNLIRRTLEGIHDADPAMAAQLRQQPAYAGKPNWSMGEEMLARQMNTALSHSDPIARSLAKKAYSGIQPEMYKDAWRLPLEIPYAGSLAARNAWTE